VKGNKVYTRMTVKNTDGPKSKPNLVMVEFAWP